MLHSATLMLMTRQLKRSGFCVVACILFLACAPVHAQNPGIIGLPLLQALTTNLNGAGVRVGQAEAALDTNGIYWEVNPSAVPSPAELFTWYSNTVSSNSFPNSIGGESGHADAVGQIFYGPSGMATNVAHVDNFDADPYLNFNIGDDEGFSTTATDAIVNQSYTVGNQGVSIQEELDSAFDDFSETYNTLFVSAADNQANSLYVCAPGTSYNCICAGTYDGGGSIGPTIDNGRCKPDLVAPASETSYSTPEIAGAAALLMQAGQRGDGGTSTNSASDMRTVKALLLNGAVKPATWVNIPPSPLDYTNGAGVLNVFNSYEELIGGKHGWNFSTNIPTGSAHPPVVTSASVPVLNGWDFNTNDSSSADDAVNHYFFNVTNSAKGSGFTFTATLVWNRHKNETDINNLALYLYNAANSNLVAASTSVVDNVQHVYVRQLPQGRYDLQVWKAGGTSIVSTNETYALAWAIVSQILKVEQSGTNLVLSWPVYPDGYAVASTPALASVAWSTNGIPASILTTNQNVVLLPDNNGNQFFRLQTPNF
ncbi:MAG TPA: S8 family serine peptidase [Candidatus Sulfotelmatobacter sp.]|nr:S8 family serine peptidase [Candidatus Sulfotelmatobacter sp.]